MHTALIGPVGREQVQRHQHDQGHEHADHRECGHTDAVVPQTPRRQAPDAMARHARRPHRSDRSGGAHLSTTRGSTSL